MRLRRALLETSLVLIVIGLVAACGAGTGASGDGPELEGTVWDLVEMNGASVGAQGVATLDFVEGEASGIAFCNRFFGPYEQDDQSLSFGPLATTRMACPNMEPERDYMAALESVASAEIEDERLILMNAKKNPILVYVPGERQALEGTIWLLANYRREGQIEPVMERTRITALLTEGTVRGSAGCNTYSASYTLDSDDLEVEDLSYTEKACEDPIGVMQQEQYYFENLEVVDSYSIAEGTVVCYDADGNRVLTYVALTL